jgi:hypothetical protein
MMVEGPPEGFVEMCNGTAAARRSRLGSGIRVGCIGIELLPPCYTLRNFCKWVALRRIQQLRAARGIPYDADSITTACDFESL